MKNQQPVFTDSTYRTLLYQLTAADFPPDYETIGFHLLPVSQKILYNVHKIRMALQEYQVDYTLRDWNFTFQRSVNSDLIASIHRATTPALYFTVWIIHWGYPHLVVQKKEFGKSSIKWMIFNPELVINGDELNSFLDDFFWHLRIQ